MAEPVSLSEAKAQCRMVEDNSEDTYIESLISPARALVELEARYPLVDGTHTETVYAWGDYLEIAWHNVTTIGDITYTDATGEDATYSDFLAKLGGYPVRIYPGIDSEFPDLGLGGAISVPVTVTAISATSRQYLRLKRAILLRIGFEFDNRGEVPLSADQELAWDCALEGLRPVSAY